MVCEYLEYTTALLGMDSAFAPDLLGLPRQAWALTSIALPASLPRWAPLFVFDEAAMWKGMPGVISKIRANR